MFDQVCYIATASLTLLRVARVEDMSTCLQHTVAALATVLTSVQCRGVTEDEEARVQHIFSLVMAPVEGTPRSTVYIRLLGPFSARSVLLSPCIHTSSPQLMHSCGFWLMPTPPGSQYLTTGSGALSTIQVQGYSIDCTLSRPHTLYLPCCNDWATHGHCFCQNVLIL